MMVQLPVPLRVTAAEETPLARDWLPMEQGPAALKFTCNPLDEVAVTVTVGCESERTTELGRGPSVMV